eukprot:5943398-Amphidinium_carterae.2
MPCTARAQIRTIWTALPMTSRSQSAVPGDLGPSAQRQSCPRQPRLSRVIEHKDNARDTCDIRLMSALQCMEGLRSVLSFSAVFAKIQTSDNPLQASPDYNTGT